MLVRLEIQERLQIEIKGRTELLGQKKRVEKVKSEREEGSTNWELESVQSDQAQNQNLVSACVGLQSASFLGYNNSTGDEG